MILLAFSMPSATPKIMIRQLTDTARMTHRVDPWAEAVAPKTPPMVSISVPMAIKPPERARKAYLKIHPMTHE